MSRNRSFALLIAAILMALAGAIACSQSESDGMGHEAQQAPPPATWQDDPALPEPPEYEGSTTIGDAFDDEAKGTDDPRVGQIEALAKAAQPNAVDQVLALTLAAPVLPGVQEAALDALEDLGWKDYRAAAVEAVGKIMAQGEPRVRSRAVEALDFLKSDRSTELLIAALQDEHPQIRSEACDALLLRVKPEHLEPVKRAYLAEQDRGVKLSLWELLENIAIERQKAGIAQVTPQS